MKKEQKRNLLLASVTALLLLIIYIMMPSGAGGKAGEEESLVVYSMDADTVTGIAFQSGDERIVLVRQEDGWVYAEDGTFPLNQGFVDTMLDKTARLTARRFVAEGSGYFGGYGLDHPTNVIQVTGSGRTETIYLGSTNSATGDCYMAVEGSEKIYTVDSTFSNLFSSSLNAMAIRETLPGISLDNMTMVTIEEKGGTFTFQRPGPGDGSWSVLEDDGALRPADTGLVSGCLGKLVKLRYEEMAVYRPSEVQMEEYGLGGKEAGGLLRIAYQDGTRQDSSQQDSARQDSSRQDGSRQEDETGAVQDFVLHIGKDSGDGRYTYVYPEGGQGIYTVRKDGLEPFMHLAAEDFLSLSIAPVKAETLTNLTLTWDNGKAEFAVTHPEDGNKAAYTLNGHEITEAEFNAFYYPLYGFAAEKRVSDMASQLIGPPILTIEYRCIPGTAGDMTVELIPYDQNYYGAKVDGQAFLLVNRQRVNSLINEVNKLPLS